jgi:dTDP-4-dehydrorhamnose 3,5-epimerase
MESLVEPQLLEYRRFEDSRGYLLKPCVYPGHPDDFDIVDLYISKSASGVFRGIHLQVGSYAQSKFVAPLMGTIVDFAVDLRRDLPTYGSVKSFELSAEANLGVYIPRGFGHGFYSATSSLVINLSDSAYSPENESGVNPLSFREIQSLDNISISAKDQALPFLAA